MNSAWRRRRRRLPESTRHAKERNRENHAAYFPIDRKWPSDLDITTSRFNLNISKTLEDIKKTIFEQFRLIVHAMVFQKEFFDESDHKQVILDARSVDEVLPKATPSAKAAA